MTPTDTKTPEMPTRVRADERASATAQRPNATRAEQDATEREERARDEERFESGERGGGPKVENV